MGTADPARRTVLILHDAEGRPDHLLDFGASLGNRHVIIPRAPRWASLRGAGLFNWFTSPERGKVDPIGFGDSLVQLELLLLALDEGDSNVRLGVIGFGQGAAIAAALVVLWPERFAWLALAGGFWPDLPDHLLPIRPMWGLPVLAVRDGSGQLSDTTVLADRGAIVVNAARPQEEPQATIREWIAVVDPKMGESR